MTEGCEARGLSFSLKGGRILLDGVSFRLRPGEMLAVCGPNGAGKSTLLRVMAGLLRPSCGDFVIGSGGAERSVFRMGPAERALALAHAPQEVPDGIALGVRDAVMMGRAPHQGFFGRPSARDKAACAEWMHRLELDRLADQSVATLSGGQRRLVMVARALCQETPLLLADEPVAALDVRHGQLLMNVLSEECAHGRTVVVVMHDLNLAAMHAHSMLLLSEGKKAALGTPDEVLQEKLLCRVYGCRLSRDTDPCGFPRISHPAPSF